MVVVSDFDDTIVDADTGTLILEKFANGDWRYYDEMYDRMEMPVEEVIKRQFAMVKASKQEMLDTLKGVKLRAGFGELIEECRRRQVTFEVASYGLDFCIKKFLEGVPEGGAIRVTAPLASVNRKGISFRFPRPLLHGSTNLKLDLVRYHKLGGDQVMFIGDGTSDLPAIREADLRFAISGSRLDELCREHGVRCSRIRNFHPVIDALRKSD